MRNYNYMPRRTKNTKLKHNFFAIAVETFGGLLLVTTVIFMIMGADILIDYLNFVNNVKV